MSDADTIVGAVRGGALAVLPLDTVYGLVCTAFERGPAVDLYRLKGRSEIKPTAVVFASESGERLRSSCARPGCVASRPRRP